MPVAGRSEAIDQQLPRGARGADGELEQGVRIGGGQEWRGPDLNRRHPGFQPSALPAELPRRGPNQASTGRSAARQSIGSRNSTSSPIARRNSLAASPPLMHRATGPRSRPERRAHRVARRRRCVRAGRRRVAGRDRDRDRPARDDPSASSRSGRRRPRAQLPKRSTCTHGARSSPGSTVAPGTRQADQLAGIDRLPQTARRLAERQPPGGRSKHVAPVKRRATAPACTGERSCAAAIPPQRSAAATSSPLSGPTKPCRRAPREHERAPVGADARVDDRQVDARWHVRDGVGQRPRARRDVARRHAVREVEYARLRRDVEDRTLHDAGVRVARAEVRQERDEPTEGTLPLASVPSPTPRMRTSRSPARTPSPGRSARAERSSRPSRRRRRRT